MEYLRAFLIGGLFCLIAQILIDKTKISPARILVMYVVCGVVLGGIGIYQYLINFAGAGAATPLTGFGYLIAKGVREDVKNYGIIGALTGGLKTTSGGITLTLFLGLVSAFLFSSKPRNT